MRKNAVRAHNYYYYKFVCMLTHFHTHTHTLYAKVGHSTGKKKALVTHLEKSPPPTHSPSLNVLSVLSCATARCRYEFLQLSKDPTNIDGFPQWRFTEIARKAEVSLMPVTLAIVWVLVFLLVGFGGRVCGWVSGLEDERWWWLSCV